MNPFEIVKCPWCGKKLGLIGTMLQPGSMVVCVTCDNHLLVEQVSPLRIGKLDPAQVRTEDAKPEAYG